MSKKESAIDIAKYIDKGVRIKLAGGREGALSSLHDMVAPYPSSQLRRVLTAHATPCTASPARHAGMLAVHGVLKGYDQLLNLVLDEAVEYWRGLWHPPCAFSPSWRAHGARGLPSVF